MGHCVFSFHRTVPKGRRGKMHCTSLINFFDFVCCFAEYFQSFLFTEGTRESAFFTAIASAGIAHAVATACSQGNISDCTCNETPDRRGKDPLKEFTWAGCNGNIRHGLKTALDFLRDQDIKVTDEHERKAIELMNRHNIKAGRQVGVKDVHSVAVRRTIR